MSNQIQLTNYPNATIAKLTNRRVCVHDLEDDIGITFKIITTKEEAKKIASVHKVDREVIRSTAVRITIESAIALYQSLGEVLTKKSKNGTLNIKKF